MKIIAFIEDEEVIRKIFKARPTSGQYVEKNGEIMANTSDQDKKVPDCMVKGEFLPKIE